MNKEPKLMDAARMRDIFNRNTETILQNVFINNEMAVVHGNPSVFRLVIKQNPPFIINDYRIGIVFAGEADINLNLQDYHITAGSIIYLGPGTIISPKKLSEDLRLFGIGLFSDFDMPFTTTNLPSAFNGQVRHLVLQADSPQVDSAQRITDVIWQIVMQDDYHRPVIASLVAALMHHIDHIYHLHNNKLSATRSREQSIFDRFLQLVNSHFIQHRHIDYYARRMCLTSRYLGTVIRLASGVTAKQWIDRAVINYAKTQLLHSDKTIAQIAEELNFPNPSFFTKYFKRLTGTTPLAFARNE